MKESNESIEEQSPESQGWVVSTMERILQDRVWEHLSEESREMLRKKLEFIEKSKSAKEMATLFDQPYPGGALSELKPEQIKGLLTNFVARAERAKEKREKKGEIWGMPGGGGENLYYMNYRLTQAALEKFEDFISS